MGFDIDEYSRRAAPVDVGGVDFAAFRDRPLSAGTLRCLRYMHDIESHTVCYLRDLLLTHGHRDPRVTTFLTMWNYEEFWHGEVLGRVLAAHDEPAGRERVAATRRGLGLKDRFSPLASAVGSSLVGEDFVAVHMTWGAINEWSTRTGYAQLIAREGHPELTALITAIMRQESRHIAFYVTEARRRLDGRPRAQRITRLMLRRLWQPVGSGVMPPAETRFLLGWLFDGPEGWPAIRRIDADIDRLPGLAGLGLVAGRAARWGVPPERDPRALMPGRSWSRRSRPVMPLSG
jgi:hypothetical protein